MAEITGTPLGETLTGTNASDDIYGLGGDDTLDGPRLSHMEKLSVFVTCELVSGSIAPHKPPLVGRNGC